MSGPDHPIALNLARIVHRLLVDPRGWRVDLLHEDLGVAPRTYRKYRGLLRDHLEHAIDPSGRWRIEEVAEGEARYLRLKVAEDSEENRQGFLGRLAGFWLARRLFEFSGDSELRDAAEGAWAEFVAGIKDKPFYLGHLLRNSERMLHYVPDRPKDYHGHEDHIAQLLRALFYSRQVELTYHSMSKDELTTHELCPLTLLMWRSALYLVASYKQDGHPYLFGIERIESVQTLPDRFRYPSPAEYDPAELFQGSFGIWQQPGARTQRVELRFAAEPWLHRYLKERTWHPSQVFTEDPQGRLHMTMDISSLVEVAPWVRSFGGDVDVLAPGELVEELKTN